MLIEYHIWRKIFRKSLEKDWERKKTTVHENWEKDYYKYNLIDRQLYRYSKKWKKWYVRYFYNIIIYKKLAANGLTKLTNKTLATKNNR